jgi:hypothetical protein
MARELADIIRATRFVISNPSIRTTLIQTEDLAALCDAAERSTKPLEQRRGYVGDDDPNHPVQVALRAIAVKHGYTGVVLVMFGGERVGARSWGSEDTMGDLMDGLAQRFLTDIDDGKHDPIAILKPEGTA